MLIFCSKHQTYFLLLNKWVQSPFFTVLFLHARIFFLHKIIFQKLTLFLPYFNYHLQTPLLKITGPAGPRGEWHSIGWLRPTGREMEKISKDNVNIIGCHRPEARIERGWETVFLKIAQNILTIIGCSRPEAQIGNSN